MNYYIDLTLLPDDEVPIFFIRNKIYQKFHKKIFDLNTCNIGVSFPKFGDKLGDVIRIHSSQSDLEKLQNLNWLGGLSGYCKTSNISKIPDKVKGYQVISRIRQTMNETKLSQRISHQTQNNILKTDTDIQAYENQYRAKMIATGLGNPYLELNSSKGGLYRIYLHFGKIQNSPIAGKFNNFGLSKTATIPIF
ncbi:CRISPR-associated protein, Csy4 family [Bathymodiolus thermophilus thioautotrophic gill symbiont]|uniref:Type I-F CRISPR-associated endoribonuclease Cas6/Csy4 n=1 Tax=Bathymodiolus thermophilus thioautotrophic gill symbiont TaxID=2360 RepID=A0A1J5TU48_9GAMM|nr:type I-F CRISPR-associated endoribonuclease Cas6/Csy4 [Bathymodiolus thermophilus thioautotrophic gill symbiont]OIR23699.1 type I-F CRISPR-associated endoribonuclease Cas6/Csy4 [Bathymodiolus thermophilus thioautotrophic gill symbiont]CAB5503925.1 hypothetical protein THERMOS_1864 [Bathymodiolus thermophilus thioautotrophic gill symbiont]SGZ80955.1 CRISPR-associated protein, Csy4 family [Bathymodiolus thermophilus thioautotrophic gill symbiont]